MTFMTQKKICVDCASFVTKDEIALTKKICGRNVMGFYCIECLAETLGCDKDDLVMKIEEFKESGCGLFL